MEISMDTVAMTTALGLMLAVIFVKVFTGHLINQMQEQIFLVDNGKKQTLSRLKMIQAQRKVARQNKAALEHKKKKLEKRKKGLEKELQEFKEDIQRRRRKSEELKGTLVRSPT